MSRIDRRALLFNAGGAVIASTVAATALVTEPRRRDRELSRDLRALIKAHKQRTRRLARQCKWAAVSATTTEPTGLRKGRFCLYAPMLR